MSSDSPSESISSQVAALQDKVGPTLTAAELSERRAEVQTFDNTVQGLAQRVHNLRQQGYVFDKGLETRTEDLSARWSGLRATVTQRMDEEAEHMDGDAQALRAQMVQLAAVGDDSGAASQLAQAQAAQAGLDERASAADRTIDGLYAPFATEVSQLTDHLDQVEWTLAQVAEASFQLHASEGAIMAVNAVWCQHGKQTGDDPAGVLYLTDQRVLFEQKQEIATKKILFVATAKQKVQKLLLDAPAAAIESAQATKQGLLGHEDHVEFHWSTGAPVRMAHFHIDGQDSNAWQALAGRVKSRAFDQDRAVPIEASVEARERAAPSKCPNCGSAITQTIARGTDSITCEFCGSVIRW